MTILGIELPDISDKVGDEEFQSSELLQYTSATRDTNFVFIMKAAFIWACHPSCPIPLCIVCGMRLTNLAFVTITCSLLTSKAVDYFKWFSEYQNSKAFVQK